MASSIGILLLNFSFMMIAILALMSQSWYQCRKWNSIDVSNATVIGDNYEASVIFLITGYQYISTAMAFNFGYSFRSHWMKNKYFAILSFVFTALHVHITLVPGKFSCFFRVNCSNEVSVRITVLFLFLNFKSLPSYVPESYFTPLICFWERTCNHLSQSQTLYL
jgi:magnesium-transporting ATPase (P-type)